MFNYTTKNKKSKNNEYNKSYYVCQILLEQPVFLSYPLYSFIRDESRLETNRQLTFLFS